jgi:hypothetical protein
MITIAKYIPTRSTVHTGRYEIPRRYKHKGKYTLYSYRRKLIEGPNGMRWGWACFYRDEHLMDVITMDGVHALIRSRLSPAD